ncbi:hypothetical protein ACFW08_34340 [Streptomyces sp. NPDC058960]|uniref:COG1470 family protein n=1 Tax=Streptomyces sp. NPDC058960 TaxID=3346679 RepID=UPI0036C915C6
MPYVRPASACALALAVACASPLVAAPAVAEAGWSLGGAGGRPYVYAEGEPGSVLEDAVSVRNPGGRPLTVRLRGAQEARGAPGDSGPWIAFARTTGGHRIPVRAVSVTVPARSRADVPFTVAVPAGAAPGDHPGSVVASADGRSTAVRLRLRVVGPALSALTVEHMAVRGGRITYELVNRGTTVLTPRLAVRADGVLGRLLDRPERTLPLDLPPGRRVRLTEPWPHHPVLDAVHVRVTVTAAGGAQASGSASARFVPWGAVAGSGAGLLAAAVAGVAVRRRRRPPDRRTGERPCPDPESTGALR